MENHHLEIRRAVGSRVSCGTRSDWLTVLDTDATPDTVFGSTTVDVTALPLTLNPRHRGPGQQGHAACKRVRQRWHWWHRWWHAEILHGEMEVADTVIGADSAHRIRSPVATPSRSPSPTLPSGEATVTLTQDNGKVGSQVLTVSTPTITIDPARRPGWQHHRRHRHGLPRPKRSPSSRTAALLTMSSAAANTVTVAIADANGEWSTRHSQCQVALRVGDMATRFKPSARNWTVRRPKPEDDATGKASALRYSNVATHVVPSPSATVSPKKAW